MKCQAIPPRKGCCIRTAWISLLSHHCVERGLLRINCLTLRKSELGRVVVVQSLITGGGRKEEEKGEEEEDLSQLAPHRLQKRAIGAAREELLLTSGPMEPEEAM